MWVENACIARAWNVGSRVGYWREKPLEVDAVMEGPLGSWAFEVKTGAFGGSDLKGLLEFCRRYPRFRPLVVGTPGNLRVAAELGLHAVTWTEFLTSGPPGARAFEKDLHPGGFPHRPG